MRLIDADALMEKEYSSLRNGDVLWSTPPSHIDLAPTIDTVPVVRCARCRHGEAFKTFPGGIFCPYIKDTVPPDGYCYMGEENPHD